MSDMAQTNGQGSGQASEQSAAQQAADLELFEQFLDKDDSMEQPDRGELRSGTIVEIHSSELVVDIGSKRDGVVPQADLNKLDPEYVKSLQVGDEIDVVVSKQIDDDGIFQLSIADALQQRDWLLAQELLDNGETTEHKVMGYNKGGLTVEFNRLRGFVPASHIVDMPRNVPEEQRQAEFEKRIGQVMRLKVIEVDKKRRRLVMSQMLAEREFRAGRKEELFRTLHVGDVINGEVRSLRPFGAFVDLGGADGLLHVSEIGWTPISHPREALEVGQMVEVQVIRLDPENQRIALSRKRVMANPWETVEARYAVGETIDVTITRLVEFGAFAQIEPGIEGLIHISELADITVAEPLKAVHPGESVQAKILRIDAKRQRIGLSRRQTEQTATEPEAAENAAADIAEVAAPEGVAPEDATSQMESESESFSAVEPEALREDAPEAAREPMTSTTESAAANTPEALAEDANEAEVEPEVENEG
jgi:small subunit ribosomal protein S1